MGANIASLCKPFAACFTLIWPFACVTAFVGLLLICQLCNWSVEETNYLKITSLRKALIAPLSFTYLKLTLVPSPVTLIY